MYIDDSTCTRNGKTYRRVLLRNSYRENGKVRHETLANLSACSEAEIEAIKVGFKNKNHLDTLKATGQPVQSVQGLQVGGYGSYGSWRNGSVSPRLSVRPVRPCFVCGWSLLRSSHKAPDSRQSGWRNGTRCATSCH